MPNIKKFGSSAYETKYYYFKKTIVKYFANDPDEVIAKHTFNSRAIT